MNNICPVCGYQMLVPPDDYTICPSCATEFGVSDAEFSILELRQQWKDDGLKWHSRLIPEPNNWNPRRQVAYVEKDRTELGVTTLDASITVPLASVREFIQTSSIVLASLEASAGSRFTAIPVAVAN